MYLYLGDTCVVDSDCVIGVFDLDNSSRSKKTLAFLNNAQKNNNIVTVGDDLPKSFVVCDEKVYLTQVSVGTIDKRAKNK